jgi:tRNA-dihydrouridine synthase B
MNLPWQNQFHLAPMAGLSTAGIRKRCRELGAGLSTTGLVDAEGYSKQNQQSLRLAASDDQIGAKTEILQVFGNDPNSIAQAAEISAENGFAGFELNIGCPDRFLMQRGCGASLIGQTEQLRLIFKKLCARKALPIGLKTRSGISEGDTGFLDVYRLSCEFGLDWLSLHPRSQQQSYDGKANWDVLNNLEWDTAGPAIFCGGDIIDSRQAISRLNEFPFLSAVVIGRGAIFKPWIFSECLGQKTPTIRQQAEMIAGMLKDLVSDLDLKRSAKYVSNFIGLLKIELGKDANFIIADRRNFPELVDKIEQSICEYGIPKISGNPFLR